jgi:hypothetical protein
VGQAVHHVLVPLVSGAVLAPALVWAIAAVVLPWLISGCSLAGDAVRVTIWAVLLVLATTVIAGLLHGPQGAGAPPSALLGAVGGAAVAIGPTAINAWHATRHPPGPSTGLA